MSGNDSVMITGNWDPDLDTAELVQNLVLHMRDPARLLECYYWSQEPGIVECVRALLAMPVAARNLLEVFLAAAVARDTIKASVDDQGALKLSSPEAKIILTHLAGRSLSCAPSPAVR
jgi:hypothetical protein